jgi:hypothetical protein
MKVIAKTFLCECGNFCKETARSVASFVRSERFACLVVMIFAGFGVMLAEGGAAAAGGAVAMDTGTGALEDVATSIANYIEPARKVIYAIAAVVAIGGGISVYIKMNNEEQDVKKSIMMIVGACVFLIAAATALPKFFGQE